jgi:replicative DNA helicase
LNTNVLEKQILGCFIKDNTLLKETILRTYHFDEKNTHHRALFNAMLKLDKEGKPIDPITLLTECYNIIQDLGGMDFITDFETKGNPHHFETYEQSLIEAYKARATDKALHSFLSKKEKDIPSLVQELQEIELEGSYDESQVMDILGDLYYKSYAEPTTEMTGILSGLKDLDTLTGGWQKKNSIVIGGRPSMGKTALMLKFVLSAAESGAVPIVFSLEMSAESLLTRMIAAKGELSSFIARTPYKFNEGQKEIYRNTIGEIGNLNIEIFDKSMQTIHEIRSKVRKIKKKYEDKDIIVFIDYLTLIQNYGKFPSDHAKVSDTSARLKMLAKEYDCPVITLAQLSRGVEQRADKRPLLSDLRESGSIEQDADLILLLYRESYYKKDAADNVLEINLAKHRDGPTGEIKVYYNRFKGVIRDL